MRSIRHQLTRQLIASLIGLLGLGLTGVYLAVRHELIEAVDATLRARALAVTALTEIEQGQVQFDFSPDFLASYPAERSRRYFEVRDARGVALARSPSLGKPGLLWQAGGTAQQPKYYDVTLPNGRPGRAAALIFTAIGSGQGKTAITIPLQVIEAADRTELNENLGGIVGAIIGCGALLIAGVFWIVPRVLTRGLAPLATLGRQAEQIDADSLATRFSSDTLPAELQPIGRRLNELLARLEASFERERRFSADLAHEIRTPLAELRTLAECALKWPDARDADLDRDVLAVTLHMETLATRMLTLARGERGQLPVQLTATDMPAVVRKSWEAFAGRAAARGIHASFNLPSATVPADAVMLRSILDNLFDNAADHAPDNSEVRITGDFSALGYILQIANPAVALDRRDAERIFDRFWRKEAARTGGEHTGLGLNLARMFAATMGWSLTAKVEDAGWIVFTLAQAAPKSGRIKTS
mgnify:FL=1